MQSKSQSSAQGNRSSLKVSKISSEIRRSNSQSLKAIEISNEIRLGNRSLKVQPMAVGLPLLLHSINLFRAKK
ncbi:unnamed protein product [Ilex paraguariensis]|uniref:Uncharacterized protein n=1 Tax=Ilex paraguariensis TaxID=185542 RepID=A0ABC8UGY4_9AQUA